MISPSDDLTLGGRVVPRQHPLADVLADIRVLAADLTARYADDTPPLDVTTAIHNARTLLRRAAEINNKEAI